MELRTYLQILRKHGLLILLTTALGVAASIALYLLTPPVYSSSVTFYVSTPLSDGSNPLSAGQFAQARVNSYVALLESEKLASRVIENQNLSMTTAEVVEEIEATAQLNTVLVTAAVHDTDANRSLRLARGIANTFGPMVDELDNQGRVKTVVIDAVSGPTLSPFQVAPDKRVYGGLGLLGGLLVGVLVAVLREVLDTSVRTVEGAASLLGAPVIGVIDHDPEVRRTPLLIGDAALSTRAEAFRQLRTNLQFIGAAEKAEVLIVTSSVPAEGKSITSANLAVSMAELGQRVLLIEADLRRPTLSFYFGMEREIGLTSVLAGQVALADAVQVWGSDGLHVLPSGGIPPNPAELLGGPAMASLMSSLRTQFDKIIIDTPPLLPVTDAAVCSAVADGVVLVMRWGRTHRHQVQSARAILDRVDARLIGGVLNARKVPRSAKRRYAAESSYAAATS